MDGPQALPAHRPAATLTPAAATLGPAPPESARGRTLVYKKTGDLRACQLLLGHRKLESTVRYLGIEVDDALELSEQLEI